MSVAIEHNKKGTQGDHFSFSNEFAIFSIFQGLKKLNEVERPKEEWEYSNLRNWGSESERGDAANCFYPIYVQNSIVIGYGEVIDDSLHPSVNEKIYGTVKIYTHENEYKNVEFAPKDEVIAIYPIDDSGIERKWRYAFQTIDKIYSYLIVETSRNGNYQIKMPKHSDQYKTFWANSKYNAGDYGTTILTSLGFGKDDFEFPKSLYTVLDCVRAIS